MAITSAMVSDLATVEVYNIGYNICQTNFNLKVTTTSVTKQNTQVTTTSVTKTKATTSGLMSSDITTVAKTSATKKVKLAITSAILSNIIINN